MARRAINDELLIPRRLGAHQITRHEFSKPGDLVAWLGAVQAQDFGAAKWALGLRLAGDATDARIETALSAGAILRTHLFRWTWHFVCPEDIRWMLALVAPLLIARAATRHRRLGLDAGIFRRSNRAIEKALRDRRHLTRAELAAALIHARVQVTGGRLSHLLGRAELDGLICSGTMRAEGPTFALLDERAPEQRSPPARDEALANLARRYFRSRGPATLGDFVWWSGLSPSDARAGLGAAKSALVSEELGGRTHWRDDAPAAPPSHAAFLLPAFDEYLVAYRDRDAVLDPKHVKRINAGGGLLAPSVVVDGRVVGIWRRAFVKNNVAIRLRQFSTLTGSQQRAIIEAASRYSAFLGLDATIRRAR